MCCLILRNRSCCFSTTVPFSFTRCRLSFQDKPSAVPQNGTQIHSAFQQRTQIHSAFHPKVAQASVTPVNLVLPRGSVFEKRECKTIADFKTISQYFSISQKLECGGRVLCYHTSFFIFHVLAIHPACRRPEQQNHYYRHSALDGAHKDHHIQL